MDDTHVARGVNPNATVFSIALQAGGGFIPESGCFNSRAWAAFLNVTEAAFRSYVKKHAIPSRSPGGGAMFVDAADFIRCVPFDKG